MFKVALLMLLTPLAIAQTSPMFTVQGSDKHYSEVEAMRGYNDAVSVVQNEYHVVDSLAPEFKLVLGGDQGVWFAGKERDKDEIHLSKWDVRYFREGVLVLASNKLLNPERIKNLELRIEHQQAATVSVETLKK